MRTLLGLLLLLSSPTLFAENIVYCFDYTMADAGYALSVDRGDDGKSLSPGY